MADVALNAYFERREIQVKRFAASDFSVQVKPTDAEIEAFYNENPGRFQAPEQADVSIWCWMPMRSRRTSRSTRKR
ncbi:MAG: hypothetical protein R3E42_00810 [Burkholderiaceae bacterium]